MCRSTLASEACAADEATDRSCFVNHFLTELFHLVPAFKGEQRLASLICTDAKSLYDVLTAENPALTDKSSMVQVRSVQETFLPKAIRWVPTHLQHSDCLTKIDLNLCDRFRQWLQRPWAQLVDDRKNKTSVKDVVLAP